MRKLMFIAVVCAFMAVPALADLSISYGYKDSATHDLSSPYTSFDGFTVDTFDAATPTGWTYSGTAGTEFAIRKGDVSGKASAPYDGEGTSTGKDTTKYLAIPALDPDGNNNDGEWHTVSVDFGGGLYKYLGLHWGSEDSYNEIRFFLDGALQDTITGKKVADGGVNRNGEGAQSDRLANSYVNIFTDFNFDSIELRSQDINLGAAPFAFELDNLTVAVPVPAAVLLGMLGLSVAGLKLRKIA